MVSYGTQNVARFGQDWIYAFSVHTGLCGYTNNICTEVYIVWHTFLVLATKSFSARDGARGCLFYTVSRNALVSNRTFDRCTQVTALWANLLLSDDIASFVKVVSNIVLLAGVALYRKIYIVAIISHSANQVIGFNQEIKCWASQLIWSWLTTGVFFLWNTAVIDQYTFPIYTLLILLTKYKCAFIHLR